MTPYPIQPRRNRYSLPNSAGLAHEQEKRRLKRIFHVVRIVQHSPADAENHRPVPPQEYLEGRLVSQREPAVEQLRVEAARLMLETGRHGIDAVARDTGFGDRERMRRAFLRAFRQPPQAIVRTTRSIT